MGPERSAAVLAYLPIDVTSADAVERRIGVLEEVLRRLGPGHRDDPSRAATGTYATER